MAGPGRRTAVVTNASTGTVAFLDTRTRTADGPPLRLGPMTRPSAVVADGVGRFAYVAGSGPVTQLDVRRRQVVRTYAGTAGATDVAVDRAGRRLAAASWASDTVTVVDPRSGRLVRRLVLPGRLTGALAFSENGRTLYVATAPATVGGFDVRAFDTRSCASLASAAVPLQVLDLAPTRSAVWATASLDRRGPLTVAGSDLLELDPASLAVRRAVRVGDLPSSVTVTPNGRTAYVVNNHGSTVSVVDVRSARVRATVAVGFAPTDVAVARNGDAFVTETGDAADPGTSVATLEGG
jgi:YVTN family beta-propeller protein